MDKTEELIAANLVLPIIKDLVLPKLKSIIKKYSLNNIDEDAIEKNFQTYLSQRYEKYLIIDTLVFPNKQTLFNILYEPLTVETYTSAHKGPVNIKIEGYPKDLLPQYIRVMIEDTAGMGKSTITKKLFLSIIEENAGIPIFIELRQINKRNNFLKEIQNQISLIGKQISLDVILKLLNEGEFIFLFDGFDEISKADREFVIKDLHKFIEKANNNYFLITSRPDESLVSFGGFQRFNIKPLLESEAFSLINKYDTYGFKPIATDLFNRLKKNKDETLREFLTNPFLVSLLYKSFEYKKDIPIKKSQFYGQVYDALFESHDLSKEGYLRRDKYSNLHLDEFERVLRHIAYLTSIENKVEYDKNYIINIIDKSKKYIPDLSFKSNDFLKDLLETVPLFKRDGNYFKWAHKSLQDYFSAKFIWNDARNSQENILRKIYNDENNIRFFNILDLFYELDPKTFESTILLWFLEEFQNHCTTNYTNLISIPDSLIKRRLELTFVYKCIVVVPDVKSKLILKGLNEQIRGDYFQEVFSFRTNYLSHKSFSKYNFEVYTLIQDYSKIDTIVFLLSRRLPNLISSKPLEPDYDVKLLKEGDIFKVNDEKNNPVNELKYFGLINNIMTVDITLDYDNSFKKLKQIQDNSKKNLENELTNW